MSHFRRVLERLDIFLLKESEIYRWLHVLFIKTFSVCLLCVRPLTWALEDIIESSGKDKPVKENNVMVSATTNMVL